MAGGTIQADSITNSAGTGAPNFPNGFTSVVSYFLSTQVNTSSTNNLNTSFTTFSNSPAFTFTPNVTGVYKIYCNAGVVLQGVAECGCYMRVFNTTGGASLVAENQAHVFVTATEVEGNIFIESLFTLTAGASYTFDIQGYTPTGFGTSTNVLDGSSSPFYMIAELI